MKNEKEKKKKESNNRMLHKRNNSGLNCRIGKSKRTQQIYRVVA